MTVTMAPLPWAGQQAPEMRLELFAALSRWPATDSGVFLGFSFNVD